MVLVARLLKLDIPRPTQGNMKLQLKFADHHNGSLIYIACSSE